MPYHLRFQKAHSYGLDTFITLPIRLRANGISVILKASLDTGASYCLFQRAYGESLGFEIESGQPLRFETANSAFQAYGHEVEIETLGLGTHSMVYFFADTHIRKNVLGREGWLNRVRFGLDHHDSRLYVAPHSGE